MAEVCRDAASLCGGAPAFSAQFSYAASTTNPGQPDPDSGTFTQLQDELEGNANASLGGNKGVSLVVHDIQGGVGPYTVDFSGLAWGVRDASLADPVLRQDTAESWVLADQLVPPPTATGDQSVPGAIADTQAVRPAGSTVTIAQSGFAFLRVMSRMIYPLRTFTPPDAQKFDVEITPYILGGTVTVTDSTGQVFTLPTPGYSDTFTIVV